jgi:hypothetical protein
VPATARTAFWDEFWAASEVEDGIRREEVRTMAESAAMLGAVLRYGFGRNSDGSASEKVTDKVSGYLVAWFPE